MTVLWNWPVIGAVAVILMVSLICTCWADQLACCLFW